MDLKWLLLILLVIAACGKSVKVKVGNGEQNQVVAGPKQELKGEERLFNEKEVEMIENVCTLFKNKREYIRDKFSGKKLYFNIFKTNCLGVHTDKVNIPLILLYSYDVNEEKLLYKVDRGSYQNLEYFPEEESDKSGLMEEFCLKSGSLKKVFNITYEGKDRAQKVTVTDSPPNNIKITFENFLKEKNSDYFKTETFNELNIITNKTRGDDFIGFVVEQTYRKNCNGTNRSTKMEELKTIFIKN